MTARTTAQSASATARDGIRVILASMMAAVMALQFALAPPMTMRMSNGIDALTRLTTLCESGLHGRSGNPGDAPAAPPDHGACVACQCVCTPLAMPIEVALFTAVVTTFHAFTWLPLEEPQRELAFHLYFSRAPPLSA